MGMTDDLEAAVAAGSTMVRVGRALFGPRPATAGRVTAAPVGSPPHGPALAPGRHYAVN